MVEIPLKGRVTQVNMSYQIAELGRVVQCEYNVTLIVIHKTVKLSVGQSYNLPRLKLLHSRVSITVRQLNYLDDYHAGFTR